MTYWIGAIIIKTIRADTLLVTQLSIHVRVAESALSRRISAKLTEYTALETTAICGIFVVVADARTCVVDQSTKKRTRSTIG